MMACAEAGKSVTEFLELPAEEYGWWRDHVLYGASTLRTQLLLMQLIQIVGGALGSRNNKPLDILPYLAEITGAKPKDKKADFQRNVRGAVNNILDKKLKENR